MRRAGKLPAFCLLFCAGCGGEEAASFRGRDAGQWANALAAEDTQASAYETLRAGGLDALPVLRALLKRDPPLAALAAGELIGALGPRADAALPDLIEALGRKGDLAVGISTSGGSANVVEGLRAARRLGLGTAALLGGDGGAAASETELALVVRGSSTPRVQEIQLLAGHILCEWVEHRLGR